MRLEDIFSKVDIQAHLRNLQSDDKEKVRTALLTIAYAAQVSGRRDCLIALAGYYVLEVRSIDDSEFFIATTKLAHSPEIAHVVLNDLPEPNDASYLYPETIRESASTGLKQLFENPSCMD